ncbi:hypothetical protein NDU88_001106 [Pleurodeles waltl]|uniref:Secreted protein n=1 Tax=Pleurodeles waltl TaxID=8319 RepID=A0AAV7SBG5_PLEWA|nr:hypothetical protein NDU88_001106 [Pleurodeles waltl]
MPPLGAWAVVLANVSVETPCRACWVTNALFTFEKRFSFSLASRGYGPRVRLRRESGELAPRTCHRPLITPDIHTNPTEMKTEGDTGGREAHPLEKPDCVPRRS